MGEEGPDVVGAEGAVTGGAGGGGEKESLFGSHCNWFEPLRVECNFK